MANCTILNNQFPETQKQSKLKRYKMYSDNPTTARYDTIEFALKNENLAKLLVDKELVNIRKFYERVQSQFQ